MVFEGGVRSAPGGPMSALNTPGLIGLSLISLVGILQIQGFWPVLPTSLISKKYFFAATKWQAQRPLKFCVSSPALCVLSNLVTILYLSAN